MVVARGSRVGVEVRGGVVVLGAGLLSYFLPTISGKAVHEVGGVAVVPADQVQVLAVWLWGPVQVAGPL